MVERDKYPIFDLERLIMALLIPFLHVYDDNAWNGIKIVEQYFSRLGVPFFFLFLVFSRKKIARVGLDAALKSYLKRIGSLFFLWSIIYFPLSLRNFGGIAFIQEYIFKTPYFLWYLSASFVGGGCLLFFIKQNYYIRLQYLEFFTD